MTKLVMGYIVCMGPDDEEVIPYDEAVIHIEGDEDSEIRINCPGALRLAPKIVTAVNSHDALIAALNEIAAMDPKGIRADDLGRAARIAAEGIRSLVGGSVDPK